MTHPDGHCGEDDALGAIIGDELRLLLPIAMADGSLHARERTMLERYAMARARAAGLEPAAGEIAILLQWAQSHVPDGPEAGRLVARLRLHRADGLGAVWEAAQSLSEADGVVTTVESVRLARLKKLLEPTHD